MSALLLLCGLAHAEPVTGVVRERGTREPVEAAFVRVGSEVIATTNLYGIFSADLPPGEHQLIVGSYAHELLRVAITVPTDERLTVFLSPAPPESAIVVEAHQDSPHVSRQILDRERVEKTPGTHDDPFRLIQALPGVAATPEYSPSAGDLVIRGAAPAESRIFVDGVEIPYLYHFQAYSSVLHTRLLDEVSIFPSTFGAPWGDAVGGVVVAETREADAEHLHGGANANFIMVGGYLQVPTGDNAVSASARRSYLDVVESSNDQYTLWPTFWDYLGRYDQALGEDHTLSITAFGAGDSYGRFVGDSALLDPLEQEVNPEFVFERAFHSLSLRLQDDLAAARLSTSLAFVRDDWNGTLPDAYQLRQEGYTFLRHEALIPIGDHEISAGLEARLSRLDLQIENDRVWTELEREAPLLTRGVSATETLTGLRGGAWVEPRFRWDRLTVQPGARLQADNVGASVRVDPRLTTQLTLAEDVRLRAGGGVYTQAPPLELLSPTLGDPDLPHTRSSQAAVGADVAIASRWEWSLEGWGKTLQDAVVRVPGEAPASVDGYAWGVELTTRYRMRDLFFSWMSITVGRALRDGAPFDYDQPFAFNLVTSWDFRPNWNAGFRYRYAAGLPFTPVEDGVYDANADSYLPVNGDPNSARLPNYQKLDGHLERKFIFRRWSMTPYAELWWVPPTGNVMYPAYSYDYSQQGFVAGPSFLPLLGIRAEL